MTAELINFGQARREMKRRARQVRAVDAVTTSVVAMLSGPDMVAWLQADREALVELITERLTIEHPELFEGDIQNEPSTETCGG